MVFDDVLSTSASPYLDYSGLLFKLSNGTFVTLWAGNADDSAYGSFNYWGGYDPATDTFLPNSDGEAPVTLNIEPTPEPSSLILLGTGLLLMAGFLFRKAKPSMIQSV